MSYEKIESAERTFCLPRKMTPLHFPPQTNASAAKKLAKRKALHFPQDAQTLRLPFHSASLCLLQALLVPLCECFRFLVWPGCASTFVFFLFLVEQYGFFHFCLCGSTGSVPAGFETPGGETSASTLVCICPSLASSGKLQWDLEQAMTI